MFMLKMSSFLVAYAAVVCQITAQTLPQPGSESLTDRCALMDYEARRLLSASCVCVNTAGGLAGPCMCVMIRRCACVFLPTARADSCSDLSVCVLGKLSPELHKLQTFPQTDMGAGTPGKKRSLLEVHQRFSETVSSVCPVAMPP
uniref:Calcitonin peptide-like domain-containing protein n=1 Tax=Sinocyclocheilus rhinocerous TaxID=307959 RepID=A0A673MVU4_9TELE